MPRISWRKLSRMAEKSWNSWKFSPSKFSRYTVSSRLFGGEASQCPPYSYWMKLCPVCTISSLMCALAFTYASYTCRVWHVHVQYAVETAHGTPDVICQGCRHRGGFGGWSPPRFSALHCILLGRIIDLYQILAFITLKPPKLEFYTTKFVRNSPQKCIFMTFSITGQKIFTHFAHNDH